MDLVTSFTSVLEQRFECTILILGVISLDHQYNNNLLFTLKQAQIYILLENNPFFIFFSKNAFQLLLFMEYGKESDYFTCFIYRYPYFIDPFLPTITAFEENMYFTFSTPITGV